MREKAQLLYDLIALVNKSEKETTDTIIAKTIINNRNQLDELGLEDLSEKCYISQPTISRFIKKMGYKNYSTFRNALDVSSFSNKNFNPNKKYPDTLSIKNEVKNDIQEALNCIDTIDLDKLENIVKIMMDYDNIVFMGSELSMSIAYKLQVGLISLGKNVYNIYSYNYQEEMLHILEKHDDVLMICISIEGRWISSFKDLKNVKELPYKILWTIEENPEDGQLFDYVYHFGKTVGTDIGYNELMYFILILYKMILNQ